MRVRSSHTSSSSSSISSYLPVSVTFIYIFPIFILFLGLILAMGSSNPDKIELKSDVIMEQMKLHLATDAGKKLIKKIGLVYQINIAPKKIGFNEVSYVVDLKKGEVIKGKYEDGKPDATFSFTDDDFIKISSGKMNPQIAFMRGAMKIKGSISAAQKFTPDIFPKPSKM